MTPDITQERTAAFRAWAATLPDRDAARDALSLSHRTYQRMWSGTQPPPPRLLEAIADRTADRALADRLRAAARPSGAPHA